MAATKGVQRSCDSNCAASPVAGQVRVAARQDRVWLLLQRVVQRLTEGLASPDRTIGSSGPCSSGAGSCASWAAACAACCRGACCTACCATCCAAAGASCSRSSWSYPPAPAAPAARQPGPPAPRSGSPASGAARQASTAPAAWPGWWSAAPRSSMSIDGPVVVALQRRRRQARRLHEPPAVGAHL
jgi:hypothetical protein